MSEQTLNAPSHEACKGAPCQCCIPRTLCESQEDDEDVRCPGYEETPSARAVGKMQDGVLNINDQELNFFIIAEVGQQVQDVSNGVRGPGKGCLVP